MTYFYDPKLKTMKPALLILVTFLITIVSCNNKKPGETVTVKREDGKGEVTIDMSNMKDVAAGMEKIKSDLSNLTPLSSEAMNALMPAQLGGMQRTDMDVSASMGTSIAHGSYRANDTTVIEVSIIDCAGPAGSGIYGMQYLGMVNIESDDEDEYTRTIDFNGGKAFENCQKHRPECTLTYFAGGRFLVSLEGEYIGIDGLKAAARDLKL